MKKIKTILVILTFIVGLFMITGCGNTLETNNKDDQEPEKKSVAVLLVDQFKEEMKNEKDIIKVANKISNNPIIAISTEVVSIEKYSYIAGFQTEIKGYNKAASIVPIIGSIPFIAYIFEVEDPNTFAETLKSNADLRWNICTEADTMEIATVDNYVFFVMSPENFEQE